MAIALPAYNTLKKNIVTILNELSALEITAGNDGFTAERDRYRSWPYTETMTARVNVMVQNATPSSGGSHIHTDYRFTVNVDMYVIGGCAAEEVGEVEGEEVVTLTPANIVASERLDLLVSQCQFALTQLAEHDFGFTAGMIGRASKGMTLTINNQGDDQTVGTFAPARWSFDVILPYTASDNGTTFNLTDLTITMEKVLEDIRLEYSYTHPQED
jgi:hypothetical protein